jgi:hypothetical protein
MINMEIPPPGAFLRFLYDKNTTKIKKPPYCIILNIYLLGSDLETDGSKKKGENYHFPVTG